MFGKGFLLFSSGHLVKDVLSDLAFNFTDVVIVSDHAF